ncbi:MAG: hypothetical protein QOF21_2246, partial [Actinomycetota bacterium]
MGVTAQELQSLPLFEGCATEDLRPVVDAVAGLREAAEGEVICAEGDKADRWWIVADGLADVTVDGLYIATIGPGETIGELALLDDEPRVATVTAVTAMRMHEVNGDAFIDALIARPRLSVALLRQLAARLRARNLRPALPARPSSAVEPEPRPAPTASAVQPVAFDPRTPGYVADPSFHLGAVREAAAIHWSDAISSFVVTRYEDVQRLARSRSLIGSVTTMEVPDPAAPPTPGHRMMIRKDGEDHLRLRRLVSKVFTPRAIGQWQERAELIVEQLLAAAEAHDELDVIGSYALPLPAQVISEMLGMPREDTAQLREWSRTLVRGLDPFSTPVEREASDVAGRALT